MEVSCDNGKAPPARTKLILIKMVWLLLGFHDQLEMAQPDVRSVKCDTTNEEKASK
jgi:hypothetical protein